MRACRWAAGAAAWLFFPTLVLGSIWFSTKIIWSAIIDGFSVKSLVCKFIVIVYGSWLWYDWDRPFKGCIRQNKLVVKLMGPLIKAAREYFSSKLILDFEKDKLPASVEGAPVMLGCHPHGIFGVGILANFGMTGGTVILNDPVIVLTINLHFYIPVWRELCMALGFASVSGPSLNSFLKKKRNVAIVIGGARESLDSRSNVMELTIRKRAGFFRAALKHGCTVFPVITFGELDLYQQLQYQWLRKLQDLLLKIFTFAVPIFWGRYGVLPASKSLTTVVGRPLMAQKNDQPSEEQVKAFREKYIDAIRDLHYRYIHLSPNTKLIVK